MLKIDTLTVCVGCRADSPGADKGEIGQKIKSGTS